MVDESDDSVFATVYPITLLLEGSTEVDAAALLEALRRRCGEVERSQEGDGAIFAFPTHTVSLADAPGMPVMCSVSESTAPFERAAFGPALQQTWDWDGSADAVERSNAMLLLTDFMAGAMEPQQRVSWFGQVVAAIAEVLPLTARHWQHSGKLVDPAAYSAALAEDPAYGFINVRMFNVGDSEEKETVMDTLGLGALGLPDIQMHFRGALEPGSVAGFLHGVSRYVLENGPVIEHEHTVPGPDGAPWMCRHEESLVAPTRLVVDIEPSPQYSTRSR